MKTLNRIKYLFSLFLILVFIFPTVVYAIPPTITLVGETVMNIPLFTPYTEPGATAFDFDDGDISDNIVIGGDTVDFFTVGTYFVTYDVMNSHFELATQVTRTVNVVAPDTTAPVITLNGSDPMNVALFNPYTEPSATAIDNIDGNISGSIVIGGDTVDIFTVGTYTVTYNVSDSSGNPATQVTRTVNVVAPDTTAPVITLNGSDPMNVALFNPYTEPGATAIDNIDGNISGSIVIGGDTVDIFTVGTYTVTYNVSDSSGNPATQVTRTVNVVAPDTTAPVITLNGSDPMNVALFNPYTEPGATAIDNIDGNISGSIVIGGDTVDIFTVGTYTVTYNVSDSSGNPATQVTRTVNVVAPDTTAPVITLNGSDPMNVALFNPYTEPGATAIDNIDGNISGSIVIGGDTVDIFTVGTYTVTYNVSDSSGNPATQVTRTVNVVAPDTTAPVITLLGDNPQTIEFGNEYIEAGATSTDDVDGDLTANIIVDSSELSTSTLGTYEVVYSVSDSAGNTASTTRTVNVVDTTAPVLSQKSHDGASVAAGTTNVNLTFNSNENAFCRVSTVANTAYADMTIDAGTATGTSHSYTATGLSNGNTYTYYFRCQDESGNVNTVDFVQSFSVSNPAPAGGGGGGGGGGGSSYTSPVTTIPSTNTEYDEKITLVSAERTDNNVSLAWTNPSDTKYKETIVIKTTEVVGDHMDYEALSGFGDVLYQGTATSTLDTAIEKNITYYYALFAVNTDGKYSKAIVVEKKGLNSQPETTITAAPGTGTYGKYKSLAGLASAEVEVVSFGEAEKVYYYNQRVNLSEVTTRLYNLIIDKSPHALLEQDKYAIAYFIHEGTPTTIILGAGERAGVLNSYLSVFGKLPKNTGEWQDVVKIGNGRWPTERNTNAENTAEKTHFTVIYRRNPDMNNPHDNAAVTVITYGLRPADRNMDSEKAAIKIFEGIYLQSPTSALDWDIVRAIAYSGAIR
jgi:hypothetical protein